MELIIKILNAVNATGDSSSGDYSKVVTHDLRSMLLALSQKHPDLFTLTNDWVLRIKGDKREVSKLIKEYSKTTC